MVRNFFECTDEELYAIIAVVHDSTVRFDHTADLRMVELRNIPGLYRFAKLWAECNGDRTMLKLMYNDEITRLQKLNLR
jgi:hypothetical protein